MKIVQKKYLRTYIALSSIAASVLVGNKLAFAEEGDGSTAASAPSESTNPVLPVQQADESPVTAESPTEEETEAATDNCIIDAGRNLSG